MYLFSVYSSSTPAAFTPEAEWVATPGGDDRLPVGLFGGQAWGRVGGGFKQGMRSFFSERGCEMPRETRGVSDLRRDGGKGLMNQLRLVFRLIMEVAGGEEDASIVLDIH